MTDYPASARKSRAVSPSPDSACAAAGGFEWKAASKASICACMLAFAPLSAALAQSGGSSSDDGYVAPAAPAAPAASDSTSDSDAAAPAGAAPAAAAPAAAAAPVAAAPAAAAAAPSAAVSAPVSAGGNVPTTNLGNVSVTGTAIARPDAATALPVTNYSADSLRQQGITSTSQFMQQVAGNSSGFSPGFSTGAQVTGGANFANLRGLGPNKTLVLLNGRRLAVNALDGGAVDLDTIPFAAIDHVEILRSGASALYGTDAIGGVINFITKKNLNGGNFDLNYTMPTRDGGGTSQTLSATFGKGDYAKDGWNVMGTLSYQHQDAINANDRSFVVPLDSRIDAVSSFTNPGQYLQDSTGVFANPSAPGGCNVYGEVNEPGDGTTCHENYTLFGAEVQQKHDRPSFFGRGAYKINDHNAVSLSFLWIRNENYSIGAPAPSTGYPEVQPGTPFFPGNGITPAPTAAQDPDGNFDPNAPVTAYYRAVPLGQRVSRNVNQYYRSVLDFTGEFNVFGSVHYDTAFSFNQSTTDINLVQGSYNQSFGNNSLQTAINDGRFNPFNPNPTASQRATLQSYKTTGDIESDETRAYVWDGKLTREIGDWFGAGQSALALGAQYRHETLTSDIDGYIANRAPATGQSAQHVDQNRDVEGVFGELNIPLLENLELDAQARYDNYSDVGDTVNPKVSLRYQPIQSLVLRADYSEGFHAPTLYDLYQPQVATFSAASLNDPVLCPGGTPATNGVQTRDCNQQFRSIIGGNPNLEPEKSKSWSAGFVFQPIKYVSLTADFFAVQLSQQIGALTGTYIFNNYQQYQSRFNRNPDTGAIDSFSNTEFNNGKTELNGEDVQLNVSVPTETGTYTLAMNGTYINKYEYQTAKNSQYISNVSNYSNASNAGGNIFRWQHNVTLGWSKGPFALGVVNHYQSGYHDYKPSPSDIVHRRVNPYITWDTYGSYSFDNGIQVTLGSDNVFDKDPPFSIQPDVGQAGYDARYASGVGRTVYGRLSYTF